MTAPTPLNYAPPPKARRLRRTAIWLFVAAITIGPALLYRNWDAAKKYWLRVGELWTQNRALNYSASPDQIVFTEDRAEAGRLINQSGYFTPLDAGRPNDLIVSYAPPQYVKLHGGPAENAVLFLHERRTPDGKRLLVLITYNCTLMVYPVSMYGTRELKTLAADPPPANHGIAGCMDERPDPRRRRLTLYAGQPDDSDPTHFTIAYSAEGYRGTIDGHVQDDESVTLTVRNGPAAGAWDATGTRKWVRPPLE